jgi:Derlin-2/3
MWPAAQVACGKFLGGYFLLQPLILAYAYTFSQDNPNSNVTIYILTFPAKFLPFALIALTFVMDGPYAAKQQLSGLLAAHAYDFLTRIWPTFGGGRNYIKVPNFVKRWFVGNGTPPPQTRSYGTAFQPRQQAPPSSGSSSWSNTRGPGRRLGD